MKPSNIRNFKGLLTNKANICFFQNPKHQGFSHQKNPTNIDQHAGEWCVCKVCQSLSESNTSSRKRIPTPLFLLPVCSLFSRVFTFFLPLGGSLKSGVWIKSRGSYSIIQFLLSIHIYIYIYIYIY